MGGNLSEVLHVPLTEGLLEALRGSSNDTSEEGDEDDSHLNVLMMFYYIFGHFLLFYTITVAIFRNCQLLLSAAALPL